MRTTVPTVAFEFVHDLVVPGVGVVSSIRVLAICERLVPLGQRGDDSRTSGAGVIEHPAYLDEGAGTVDASAVFEFRILAVPYL